MVISADCAGWLDGIKQGIEEPGVLEAKNQVLRCRGSETVPNMILFLTGICLNTEDGQLSRLPSTDY